MFYVIFDFTLLSTFILIIFRQNMTSATVTWGHKVEYDVINIFRIILSLFN